MGVWVPKWKFKNRERLGLDIFQNAGLVENLKFGRKNRSFLALLEVISCFISGNAFLCESI